MPSWYLPWYSRFGTPVANVTCQLVARSIEGFHSYRGIFLSVCISLTVDGSQLARSLIPPVTLPSCLWPLRISPSFLGSRLTYFYHDVSSILLHRVNNWLNFTNSRSHASRHGSQSKTPDSTRIELTTSALVGMRGHHSTTRAMSG